MRARRRLLNDQKVRGWVAQGATVLGIAALLAFFVANASENMARSGIASGFDFLGGRAGLSIHGHVCPE